MIRAKNTTDAIQVERTLIISCHMLFWNLSGNSACKWYFIQQGYKLIKEILTSDVVAAEGSWGGTALLEPSADLLSLTFAPLVAPPPDVEVRL